MTDLKPGRYKHYKGSLYEVLGTAIHSETEEELVLYKMLYSTTKYPEGTLWVRPKKMFMEKIEIEGISVNRFQYVGF
ncbi:MAG TPA: DUF1653 domain-containing protein [Cytophagales bacterium]|nr:DUF1653 domain-containing protein [Cytophagales bacterium]